MPFRWESPPFDVAADFRAPGHTPVLELREFATLEEYSAATGQDRNSVRVGYDVFVNVPALDAGTRARSRPSTTRKISTSA